MSTTLGDNRLEEWKIAREVLRQFDDRIHDLRKYGFTVVTSLLTISSVFLPTATLPTGTGGAAGLPDSAKVAAIAAIMLLIVALRYIERTYQVIQRAASITARMLERHLNLELTDKISDWYKIGRLRYADIVYGFFATAAFFLGLAVVSSGVFRALLLVMIFAVIIALRIMRSYLRLAGTGDLSFDRLQCVPGERVMFTFTNFSEDEPFRPGAPMFCIEHQDGTKIQQFAWPESIGEMSAWKLKDEFSEPARCFYVFLQDLFKLKKHPDTHLRRFLSRGFMWESASFLREKGARRAVKKVRKVYSSYPPWKTFALDLIWRGEMDTYVWWWDTTNVAPGQYRVVPFRRHDPKPILLRPLPRGITIRQDVETLTLAVKFAKIDQDVAGTSTVIEPSPGKRIRVVSYSLTLSSPGTIRFLGTDGSEAMAATDWGPTLRGRAPSLESVFQTAASSGLNLVTSGGVAKGHVAYLEV